MVMKYSVLMSVYKNDDPEFLKLALKSVYEEQTKKPDEIVIVFDGPVPESLMTVCTEFGKDKQDVVKLFPQERHGGLGEALRIGAMQCTGDYIFRMDSDDISAPNRFEIQAKYVEEHPEIDVLGTDIFEFNESTEEKNLKQRKCRANHDDIVKMSKKRSPMNHVTVCIKRSALEKVGGYKPLSFVEDYYLWLRMINAGCVFANINQSLVFVRVGNGFGARRSRKELISSWKVLQDFMTENKMITKREARRNMFYIKCFVRTPRWIKKILYSMFLRK